MTTEDANQDVIKLQEEPPSSPLKRACREPSLEERSRKRSRLSSPTPPPKNSNLPDNAAITQDKATWQGFCDIESDPAYFSVILREMGVRGVTVREVFTMDPTYLHESLPQPIHGLILLFHYRSFGTDDQSASCPNNVWFANQLPAQNSCATLAMINILMNSTTHEVDIGEHLTQFKAFTQDFSPYQRGEALSSFDFVKKIHNSFAKKMDMLESDKLLSYKVKKSGKNSTEVIKKRGTKSRRRRGSADSAASDDSADGYEENGHHFIAFVPVGNEVWKLDGMDAQPSSMGSFDAEKGETWLSAVSDTIAALMAAGDDDYGVIALTHSPLLSLKRQACDSICILRYVEERLYDVDRDWKNFVIDAEEAASPQMLGIEDELASHAVSHDVKMQIDNESMQELLSRRGHLVKELGRLTANIMMEIQQEAEEDQKAAQRRFDCGPVIKKWLEMLAENGHLEKNLHRFMPAAKGKKSGKSS